jgi:SCP1.201-like deaminase
MPTDQLDLQAVAKADERFWAKHPELHKRALTSDPLDARYRSEWLKLYEQAEQESAIPAPSVLPKPVPPPPPVNATSPVQVCPGVASMTHEEKMEAAIHSANLGKDVLRELGDIKTLIATMVIVGGGLAVAGVAAAATGVGLLVEGVAAVGAGLLVAGAAMSGWQIGQGLNSLYDFFQQTRCDTATTPQQLDQAGKKFGEGVAKVGVGTVNLLLALLGGRERPQPEPTRPQLPAFDGKTSGVLVPEEPPGPPVQFQSGPRTGARFPYSQADGHVETQGANWMAKNGVTKATFYHNNPNGTCGNCDYYLPTYLQEGSALKVVPPENAVAPTPRWIDDPKTYTGNNKSAY